MWLHFIRTLNYECAFCYLHAGGGGGGGGSSIIVLSSGGEVRRQSHLDGKLVLYLNLSVPKIIFRRVFTDEFPV
jgi:hypothetical protein